MHGSTGDRTSLVEVQGTSSWVQDFTGPTSPVELQFQKIDGDRGVEIPASTQMTPALYSPLEN